VKDEEMTRVVYHFKISIPIASKFVVAAVAGMTDWKIEWIWMDLVDFNEF